MQIEITHKAAVAARFVNSTDSHIFLTGKAGAGKTTFLRELSASTHKPHVILAPTGIAALNANGVTIHSQFLLPLGTFLPGRNLPKDMTEGGDFYSEYSLARKKPLNAKRREVLRQIDLIIIDEVSMLRADLLDAIDYRMRSVKRNFRQRFGGVQLLLIGDLYQLPPIVKDYEWAWMSKFYRSPHFFEAQSLKEDGFVYIELDKIFRQQNDHFIHILNNFRNACVTKADVDELNQHYRPEAEAEDGVITITTHNRQAEQLNLQALARIKEPAHRFSSEVDGDFPERLFPVADVLELKKGAQVMFVKNDSQNGMYFNGKLATVCDIDKESITVEFADTKDRFQLRQETWENKKYRVDKATKEMEDEVIGTFTQYPVKLAWAITVHKSQGLTFDKAVIDVGRAFASGQVYVALSRLSSLDGLVLRTPISASVVSVDSKVTEFSTQNDHQSQLDETLKQKQAIFLQHFLYEVFNFTALLGQVDRIRQKHDPSDFEDSDMRTAVDRLYASIEKEKDNTVRFRSQLSRLLKTDDREQLLERISKGQAYYIGFLFDRLYDLLLHIGEVEKFTRSRTYLASLSELDVILMKSLENVIKSGSLAKNILEKNKIEKQPAQGSELQDMRKKVLEKVASHIQENPKTSALRSGRTRKKGTKLKKGDTYNETFKLIDEGLTLGQIAAKRELKPSTIETHIVRGIAANRIALDKVMDMKDVSDIRTVIKKGGFGSVGEIVAQFNGKYTFGQIRMVQADLLSGLKSE